MHEPLRQALGKIALKHGANFRLVACHSKAEFGLAGNRLYVFIPDMHLLSNARRNNFRYGTNHTEMLKDVLRSMIDLKATATAAGQSVVVFHIGDYLDLWRESLHFEGDPDVPRRIKQDHRELVDLLEDARLNTHFLLGNHDFALYLLGRKDPTGDDYSAWERRYFIPSGNPTVVVMHGDFFDWVETDIPAGIRDIAVYLFGQNHPAAEEVLGQMMDLTRRHNAAQDYTNKLQLDSGAPLGDSQECGVPIEDDLEFNVQTLQDHVEGGDVFLEKACVECVNVNRASGTNLRTVIIGHTHRARIAVCPMPDGKPFTLVDTGAWIENCVSTEGGDAFPNAQITALSANQVRIYQLDLANPD